MVKLNTTLQNIRAYFSTFLLFYFVMVQKMIILGLAVRLAVHRVGLANYRKIQLSILPIIPEILIDSSINNRLFFTSKKYTCYDAIKL